MYGSCFCCMHGLKITLSPKFSISKCLGCTFQSVVSANVFYFRGKRALCATQFHWVVNFTRAPMFHLHMYLESESVSHSAMSTSLVPQRLSHYGLLSLGFSRQEYWNEMPYPTPRDLLDPEIDPGSPAPQADSLPSEHQGSPWCCSHFGTLLVPKQTQIPWCVKTLVIQLCPTLHNAMDCSLPGFSIHGIPQARILEWVEISFPKVLWTYIWN